MSYRQTPAGTWEVKVYLGVDPATGRKRYRTRNVSGRERDARQLERTMRGEVDRAPRLPSDRTVADAITAYLDRSSARLSARTIEQHEYSARRWINPHLGRKRLDDLRVTDVTNWLRMIRDECSPQTCRLAHATLRAALNSAVRNEWIGSNPAFFRLQVLPLARRLPPQSAQGLLDEPILPVTAATLRDAAELPWLFRDGGLRSYAPPSLKMNA